MGFEADRVTEGNPERSRGTPLVQARAAGDGGVSTNVGTGEEESHLLHQLYLIGI